MAWEGSRRGKFTSTATWRRFRLTILEHDGHSCTVPGCPTPTDRVSVDHITNAKSGGAPLDPANCQTLCYQHHLGKTSAEGNKARWKHMARRPPEPHPGLKRQP